MLWFRPKTSLVFSQFYLCKSTTLYTIYTGLATFYFAFGKISQNYWLFLIVLLVNFKSGIGMSHYFFTRQIMGVIPIVFNNSAFNGLLDVAYGDSGPNNY
jgi:hypothetical protein